MTGFILVHFSDEYEWGEEKSTRANSTQGCPKVSRGKKRRKRKNGSERKSL